MRVKAHLLHSHRIQTGQLFFHCPQQMPLYFLVRQHPDDDAVADTKAGADQLILVGMDLNHAVVLTQESLAIAGNSSGFYTVTRIIRLIFKQVERQGAGLFITCIDYQNALSTLAGSGAKRT